MVYIPKFLSRPFQGLMMAGNGLWNGELRVPDWAVGSWTENEEDLRGLNGPRVQANPEVEKKTRQSYETLGFDYEKARRDLDYVDKVFSQAIGKLKAAGVTVDDDASIDDLAAAYNKLDDAKKKLYKESDGSAKPREAAESGSTPAISNGRQKPRAAATQAVTPAAGVAPIAPRKQQVPDQTDVTTDSRYNKVSSQDTGVRANGAPVEVGDTATKARIKEAQRESVTTDALQTRRVRQGVQNDMRSDDRRRAQEHLANQDAFDANQKARRDRLRAEREAAHKERMDKRYESRTLTGMSDWENLGRDSTKRNFGVRAEGESDELWNARSGAVEAVNKLRERFNTLGVKDADKNDFYAYNPNRMRDVSGLGDLFNKAVDSGNLTDAQIEGINKTLDMYEGEGRKTKATLQRNAAMRDAENVRKYREMYGMGDRDVFSDADVKKFHAERQAASRKEILQNMQVAPGQGGGEGRGQRIRDFSDNWMKLVDNGLDVAGTFKKAMSSDNGANRKAFQEGVAGIALDDPEREDKLDQLRRRFVMNQAMSDAGLADHMMKPAEGQTLGAAMTSGLPGKSGLVAASKDTSDIDELIKLVDEVPGTPQNQKPRGQATNPPAQGVTPAPLRPRPKPDEDTQQAAKGGVVLRPRRRAS